MTIRTQTSRFSSRAVPGFLICMAWDRVRTNAAGAGPIGTMPIRNFHPGPKTRALMVVVVGLAVLVAAWDWNWFRHPVENYFIKRAQREIRVDDLHVSFNSKLEPTVRLRGVYVQNAPWADNRPFVTAGEVAFTFALRSITERRPIVSRLVLVDADVNLERQADGHRNWRLRNPENIARGRMKVIRMEARNSRIRFIRRDTDFEIDASAVPLEQPSQNAGGALTQRVKFSGRFKDAHFAGSTDTGDVLTIMESGELFPIRGHMEVGKVRMDVDGSLADLFRPSKVVGAVHVKGPSLAGLYPFTRNRLPNSKPFDFQARLEQEGDAMSIKELRAKVGGTLLTGVVSLDRTLEPPLLKAALRSDAADWSDLQSLGGKKAPPPPAPDKPKSRAGGDEAPARIFRDKPLPFGNMKKLDAELTLQLKKLKADDLPGVESFNVVAELKDGVLEMKPDIGLAEGHLRGTARVDGSKALATVGLKLDGRDIRIEKLLKGKLLAGTAAGPMQVHLAAKSRGNSMAALAANLDGTVKLGMENGVMSHLADAALELDLGKAARAVFTGNRAIGINKIDIEFDFDQGKGSARNIFVDTAQTRVVGTGSIDLRGEKIDIVLTPQPKKQGLLALDAAVNLHGPLRKPKVRLTRDRDE